MVVSSHNIQQTMEHVDHKDLEEHLVLIIADSSLPTGGFVASSGLESYWAHGLLQNHSQRSPIISFLSKYINNYSKQVAGYVLDTHKVVSLYLYKSDTIVQKDQIIDIIKNLDHSFHSMLLNHVAQRASKAQGVAFLTLYSKSFSQDEAGSSNQTRLSRGRTLLSHLKQDIRAENCHGHLPICWAVFMAAIGIEDHRRTLHVHLFLQARAILSSAVRLNIIGPYMMHRLLAFDVKGIVDDAIQNTSQSTTGLVCTKNMRSDQSPISAFHKSPIIGNKNEDVNLKDSPWEWTWKDVGAWGSEVPSIASCAPKTTWPLGDILQARHDQLHSRLFNS